MKCLTLLTVLFIKFSDSSIFCPDSEDIQPCYCIQDTFAGTVIRCDGSMELSEIETAFRANFPFKDLDEFYLTNNRIITELSTSFFNNVTFEAIYILNNDLLFQIDEAFFEGQEATLLQLTLNGNKIGNNGFPYSILPNLPYLFMLDLESNDISNLPVLIPFNNITELHYENNAISSIEQETFSNCKKLRHLHLTSNVISTIEIGKLRFFLFDILYDTYFSQFFY